MVLATPVAVVLSGAAVVNNAQWFHQISATNAARRELPRTQRSGDLAQEWAECRGANFANNLPLWDVLLSPFRPLPADTRADAASRAKDACPPPSMLSAR